MESITTSRNRTLAIAVLLAAACGGASAAETVYLPEEGRLGVALSYSDSSFDEAWLGDERIETSDLGLGESSLRLVSLYVEYALTADLAVDAGTSWFESEFSPIPDDSGLADSRIGLRWLIHKEGGEAASWPSVGIRLGAIIPGDYDADSLPPSGLVAPGQGAAGGELSLLAGKTFAATGTALLADLGLRIRAEDVPEALFGSIRVKQQVYRTIEAGLGFAMDNSLDGDDIGDPGFTLPTVERDSGRLFGSLGAGTGWGQYLSVYGEQTVSGRNVGRSSTIGLSLYAAF